MTQPADNSSRRWTVTERVLAVITALLTVASAYLALRTAMITQAKERADAAVETKTQDLSAAQDKFDQLQSQYNQLSDENAQLKSQMATPGPTSNPQPFAAKYLSELDEADHNKNAGTASWDSKARTINQVQYGHSIAMNAGCQNGDGGNFWLDYTIDGSWQWLHATVGVSDRSSTRSKATIKVLDAISGREVASKTVTAGPPITLKEPIEGIVRLRLFINDPNAPSQSCGFEKIETVVIWGDARLTRE